MENKEIKMTISDLERLLHEQRQIVVDKLMGQSGYYNSQSDDGNYRTLPIDKDKFYDVGMSAPLPNDVNVLRKYL